MLKETENEKTICFIVDFFYHWRQYSIWWRAEPLGSLLAFGSIEPWLRTSGLYRNVKAGF